jgi:hypothetical protein
MLAEGTYHLSLSSSAPEDFSLQRIVIFANGELPNLNQARPLLRDDDYIL